MGMSDSIKVARIIGAAINDGAVKLSSLEVTDSSLFTIKMENGDTYLVSHSSGVPKSVYLFGDKLWSAD